VLALLAACGTAPLGAQEFVFRPVAQFEARADALLGATGAAQLGFGSNIPVGYYSRVGITAAAGTSWIGGRARPGARVDVVSRYLLDPFREIRWAPYAGAGISTRWDDAAHWRSYLLVLAGVEGPVHRGWHTAFEAGLGGGVRVAIVLRRARTNGR
jgi:hypothetical protein